MSSKADFPPVPPAYQGVWSRSLLSTKDGFKDTTTKVFWLQTSSLFGDLRIPEPTPSEGVRCLGEASSEELLALAKQDGFAGVTEVEGNKTTWHRQVNFRPESAANVDAGIMTFADSEHVREDGLDGSYLEEWERLPESVGPTWGFRLAPAPGPGEETPDRVSLLLGAGDYFIFVADRREPATVDASTDGLLDDDRRWILDCEISFGRMSGGSAKWEIQHSTLPGRKGKSLLGTSVGFPNMWKLYKAGGKVCVGKYPPQFGWLLKEGYHSFPEGSF